MQQAVSAEDFAELRAVLHGNAKSRQLDHTAG
jgi:hypothetical protein